MIEQGELIVVCKGNKIILGQAAVVEPDLLAMHPISVKHEVNLGITDEREIYSIKKLIDYRRNQSTESDQKNRGYQGSREGNTESELLAVGLCLEAEKHHPELSVFLRAMSPETIQKAKAFLQAMLEKETRVNYRDLKYKTRKGPECRRK